MRPGEGSQEEGQRILKYHAIEFEYTISDSAVF